MPYTVLICDDSALMRNEIKKIIEQDPDLKVIGTAINGKYGVEKVKMLNPDVVTMDINMPVMDGLTALKAIMNDSPRPVIMISSLTQEGAKETIEALEAGAFDFVGKPSGAISRDIDREGNQIRAKILAAATAKKKPLRQIRTPRIRTIDHVALASSRVAQGDLGVMVGVGVSTGGPKTLMSMLPEIPADFPGCIVIAQHMPEKFTFSFAERLNHVCPMNVKEASEGEQLVKGTIYIAPGSKHTSIERRGGGLFVKVVDHVPSKIYKPSVDVLFESLSACLGKDWIGVMLTGMGGDGSIPMTKHFKAGGHTIVESEESCVVFGMPGRVVAMGGAEFILPEEEIADKIISVAGSM